MEHLISKLNIKDFLLGGNCLFTIKNSKTSNRFTFKLKKAKNNNIFFVYVLTGPNNETDYTYIGSINENLVFSLYKKAKITDNAKSVQVIKWLLININNIPEFIDFYHHNKCGRCGRKLTDPESILNGLGRNCLKLVNEKKN